MAMCSLFNRMLLLTDLISVHLLYCGRTVMIGCNHTSFEWTRAVRHIYGIIRHMQGLYCSLSSLRGALMMSDMMMLSLPYLAHNTLANPVLADPKNL